MKTHDRKSEELQHTLRHSPTHRRVVQTHGKAASPTLIIPESAGSVKHCALCSLTGDEKPVCASETHGKDVLCAGCTNGGLLLCASLLKNDMRAVIADLSSRKTACFIHKQDIFSLRNIYKNMCNMSCMCRDMAKSLWIKWKCFQNHCNLAEDML